MLFAIQAIGRVFGLLSFMSFLSDNTGADIWILSKNAELDEAEILLRSSETDLAAVRLRERRLIAPSDGVVYKFDVRPGEGLQPGDGERILFGSPL
jgi:multidrug resistance efflux pump